jgi:hypothetical protein
VDVTGVVGVLGVVGAVGVAGTAGVGVVGGVTMLDRQIEGCPEQVHPACVWQFWHPAEGLFPVSQV